MRLSAALMLAAVAVRPSFAQRTSASPAEADYLRQLAKYHYQFSHPQFGDSTLKVEQRAVKELEGKLRPIVGSFAVAGFAQPGVANNSDLFESDEDFDAVDGIMYRIANEKADAAKTVAVVTTGPILRAWLKRRADIDTTVPFDAAFARDNVLTWAFDVGGAAEPYA